MSGGLYGHRSNSSASSSPPATSGSGQTGLVVPQPINAAKGGQAGHVQGASGNGGPGHIHHSHPSNGSSGRKYQCKMCPQVGKVGRSFIFCKQTTIDLFLNTKSFKRYVSRLQKKILVPFFNFSRIPPHHAHVCPTVHDRGIRSMSFTN